MGAAGNMYRLTETVHRANERLSFHRHEGAYIAIPLEGAYEEMSVDGRFACAPGIAVIHATWHAHADRFDARGGRVLNLSLPPASMSPRSGSAVVDVDVIEIEKLARHRPASAAAEILALWKAANRSTAASPEWLGAVLRRLRSTPEAKVTEIAAELGISREHLARRLKDALGLQPSRMRIDHEGLPVRDAEEKRDDHARYRDLECAGPSSITTPTARPIMNAGLA